MENNINNELKEIEEEKTIGQKFLFGLKKNLFIILIGLIFAVYLLTQIIEFTPRTSFKQIVANTVSAIIVGWSISALLGREGTQKGEQSPTHIQEVERYNVNVDNNSKDSQYYEPYCEIKNEELMRRYRQAILARANLKYDLFMNGEYDNTDSYKNLKGEDVKFTKKQVKALKKCRNARIKPITTDYLISEATSNAKINGVGLELSINQHTKITDGKTLISRTIFGCLAGYFTVSLLINFSWANLIYGALQLSCWLIQGVIEYINERNWVVNVHTSFLKRRNIYLVEFRNMVDTHNPLLFAKIEEMKLMNNKEEEKKEEVNIENEIRK